MSSFRTFANAFAALAIVVSLGTMAFVKLEGFSVTDALWLTFVTITTVGFGDIVPHTPAGRLIALFIIISGVSLFTYILSNVFSGLLEGQLAELWWRRRMIKKISRLENHIILCGAGRVGKEAAMELLREKVNFVVVEKDPERLNELRELGVQYIAGDATEDKVMQLVNLENASGLITTLPEDTGNLFITISTKALNPNIKVVARANRPENIKKMQRAGADLVICPSAIAGVRMALSVLKPASVSYVQTLVDSRDVSIELEEIFLDSRSPLAGTELKNSGLREKYNILLLAIKREKEIILNPMPEEAFRPGDILIVLGAAESLSRLENEALGINQARTP
ncbi:MAG: potassium channel protein [Peptococcaceae bacterium]|nr:potassium channel protein [Peptococcaceae bacterium]